jgi:hypothetical protein
MRLKSIRRARMQPSNGICAFNENGRVLLVAQTVNGNPPDGVAALVSLFVLNFYRGQVPTTESGAGLNEMMAHRPMMYS